MLVCNQSPLCQSVSPTLTAFIPFLCFLASTDSSSLFRSLLIAPTQPLFFERGKYEQR